ncbi:hypothetical protein U8V72_11015 [Priestia filamentosa]|uniref:hypothetical protein n=1 Tax=Priestia filamentosa TaxID=1402861 RepID=UPI00397E1033
MARHIIPQQFNQSDKIGKFTMPQITILGAITVIYVLIMISSNLIVSVIAFFPLAIVALVLMYFKVNKIPIYEFLFIYLIYIGSPKLLVYRSDNLRSLDEKEEGIGFIDTDKNSTANAEATKIKNNKKATVAKGKKRKVTKKVAPKKEIKKPVKTNKAPSAVNKQSSRNQTQNKRVVKKVSKNRGVKK